MNADPAVCEHLPSTLDREASDALLQRIRGAVRDGIGLRCMDLDGRCVGMVGLQWCNPTIPFAPAVEASWRLSRVFWGRGLVYEAAAACIDDAFHALGLPEVLAWTVPANARSLAVMGRLGFQPFATFQHPALPADHRLAEHRAFRLDPHSFVQRP